MITRMVFSIKLGREMGRHKDLGMENPEVSLISACLSAQILT